jgi:hypothetical protein
VFIRVHPWLALLDPRWWNPVVRRGGQANTGLSPGLNAIRHLAPGVYFVREASGVGRQASSVIKVMVTR